MSLNLFVDGDSLHFQSGHYFWQVFGRRLRLPHWMTPGKTFLWHHNETPERFNIRIEIRHPLVLMAIQGALGAFDTLFHHEGTEALGRRETAARELGIHALRSSIYCGLFIGISSWAWHGLWAWVLLAVFVVEIILTLWDFIEEDRTRLLPATERVTHTVLAINAGAFIMLLALTAHGWAAQPTALVWQPQGWLGAWLALCGVGVGISALRDGLAAMRLARRAHSAMQTRHPPVRFGDLPPHRRTT